MKNDSDKKVNASKRKKKYVLTCRGCNAFEVMGYVVKALITTKKKHLVDEYLAKAKSSDYDNLLAVSEEYIEIINKG